MPDPRVTMTIIDDPLAHPCQGRCGVDWSKPESLALARERIAARFGADATLEYVDLLTAAHTDAFRHTAEKESMSLPILLANGRPRIVGEFDLRQLMDAIEVDIEAGSE